MRDIQVTIGSIDIADPGGLLGIGVAVVLLVVVLVLRNAGIPLLVR